MIIKKFYKLTHTRTHTHPLPPYTHIHSHILPPPPHTHTLTHTHTHTHPPPNTHTTEEVRGALTCQGRPRDSEVIYWKVVRTLLHPYGLCKFFDYCQVCITVMSYNLLQFCFIPVFYVVLFCLLKFLLIFQYFFSTYQTCVWCSDNFESCNLTCVSFLIVFFLIQYRKFCLCAITIVQVPGDRTYESPVTPHHGEHHDRYISFEYDNGTLLSVLTIIFI